MYSKAIVPKIDITLGYEYFTDPNHPLATGNSSRVYLHRHVMSMNLGRWLKPSEHVHHIDGNKLNNLVHNLEVISASEHAKMHFPTIMHTLTCPVCLKKFTVTNSYKDRVTCSYPCAHKKHRKSDITKEELEPLIWDINAGRVATLLGMSDKGVVKMAKRLGCRMPPPYYHSRSFYYKLKVRSELGI